MSCGLHAAHIQHPVTLTLCFVQLQMSFKCFLLPRCYAQITNCCRFRRPSDPLFDSLILNTLRWVSAYGISNGKAAIRVADKRFRRMARWVYAAGCAEGRAGSSLCLCETCALLVR